MSASKLPLIVDLDGTLINSDIFFEASLIYLGPNPLRLLKMIYWFLTQGRCGLKIQIEKRIPIHTPSLPFNFKVIKFLQKEIAARRDLVLVTGCSQKYAEQLAQHLNLFSQTYGVCLERPRLTGKNKTRFLLEKYGYKHFDYIGNSLIDISVWKHARQRIMANTSSLSRKIIKFIFPDIHSIEEKKQSLLQTLNFILKKNKILLSRILIFSIPPIIVLILQKFGNASIFKFSISNFLFDVFALSCGFILVWLWREVQLLAEYRKQKLHSLFSSYIHPYWSIYVICLSTYLVCLYLIQSYQWIILIYLYSEYLFSQRRISPITLLFVLWAFSSTTLIV